MTGVITHTLTADGHDGHDGSEDGSGRGIPVVAHPIAFTYNDYARDAGELCPTLRSGAHKDSHANSGIKVAIAHAIDTIEWIVRFLTPREGERLQGFPDDHTLVPYRGGQMKAGPRRKMIGNSMAVPVMRWIGSRIETVVKGTN